MDRQRHEHQWPRSQIRRHRRHRSERRGEDSDGARLLEPGRNDRAVVEYAAMFSAAVIGVLLCLATTLCASAGAVDAGTPTETADRLFDEYGLVRWGDEQARLDNFAIQLQNEPDAIGYIFVYDGENVCEGEAKARAIRARKYVVEHR